MQALDRAKRVQSALTKLVERRDRIVQKAGNEFRLDLLAAVDQVDDETLGLVQRGLAMDRCEQGLQYAVQLAIDERNERRRISTQRSGSPPIDTGHRRIGDRDVTIGWGGPLSDDPHEAETDAPPPPSSEDLGDDELVEFDRPTPVPPGTVQVEQSGTVTVQLEDGQTLDVPLGRVRYPEPGEPAVTLADGTVIAAP